MRFLPILMTASVSTRGMKDACFNDTERYFMYLDTLKYYMSKFFTKSQGCNQVKLIFAENSGWDLNLFRNDLSKHYPTKQIASNIEFISLSPDLFDITKGKGYNELLMINHAVDKSHLIKEAGVFFKVTGRYPIYNLGLFIRESSKAFEYGYDFYCDIKNHNLYRLLGLKWNSHSFEARLWGSTVEFYLNNIGNKYSECYDYDGRFVESVIYKHLSDITSNFRNCSKLPIGGGTMKVRFSREPRFGGLEGSSSTAASFSKDQRSFKSKVKILTGNFFRIFMPWIKF